MKGVWIEWKGYGDYPVGKVDVMFRDGGVVEAHESGYWEWRWVTGDSMSEIVSYRQLVDKKPKTKRKRPEFTFEDGFYFDFYLESGAKYNKLDNLSLFCQISGDSTGVLDKERICYIIRIVQRALRDSNEICSSWEYKTLRKKLKLYIKWLQSELSKQGD